jgi:hypothetical protein
MGSLKPADYELEVVLIMVVVFVLDLESDADNAFVSLSSTVLVLDVGYATLNSLLF